METTELTAEHVDYLVLLSDKLATKYPELNARIQRAVSIVRAGGVQLHGDDLAAVTNGGEAPYEVTGEGCALRGLRARQRAARQVQAPAGRISSAADPRPFRPEQVSGIARPEAG